MYLGFDPVENFYWSIILFLIGLIFSLKICEYFKISYRFSVILYIWHFIFCLIYFKFMISAGGDAVSYYIWGKTGGRDLSLGTGFVANFTGFFINYFNFSFIDCFVLYNLFGYIGLLAFSGAIKKSTEKKPNNIKILGLIFVFLPSVSFWSSAVGKDSIAFMATCLSLWAALNFRKHIILFTFAILAMLLVRPHIAAVIVAAYALAFIFDKGVSNIQRIFIGSMAIIASGAIVPLAMEYAGLGDAQNTADIGAYIEQRQGYNLEGGSSIDINSMSLPMQIFTYLFRPLPFEANSIFALVASLDNIFLLFLFILGVVAILKRNSPVVKSNRAFLWLYTIIVLFILATTTANLGIAMRQKWMFLPCLIFLLLSVIGTKNIKIDKGLK